MQNFGNIGIYQIIEELGAGGMGKVYKALDPKLNRFVAIKTANTHQLSAKIKARFFLEAKAMAKLRHPNIIPIYYSDTDLDKGLNYIVMEFVVGTSLENHSFTIRQALDIIKQVAFAMDYVHQEGVIHRDLKPGNIMLRKDNSPVVIDFGIAKYSTKNITQSGEIIGTPNYMAPEQALGKQISAATDVYALGTILYELLTKSRAIVGENIAQILYDIVYGEILPIHKHNPKLAKELQIICSRAMAKDPQARYQKACDLAQDIQRFLHGEVIKAQKFSIWYYLKRRLKKNSLTVLVLFLLVLAIFGKEKHQQQQQITKYIHSSQKILKQIPKKFCEIHSWEEAKAFSQGVDIVPIVEKLLLAIEPLNKAQHFASENAKITKILLQINKSIGLLTLAQKEYLLSYKILQQYDKLHSGSKKNLLPLWKQKKEEAFIKKIHRLKTIMEQAKRNPPDKKKFEFLAVEISRMGNHSIIKKLLPYIQSKNRWQRILAIKALGKLGNNYTKVEGKDSVEWLLWRLQKLKPWVQLPISKKNLQFFEEIERIIWALGWLKDSRANTMVTQVRWDAGQGSLLWYVTNTAYHRIPLPQTPAKTLKDFIVRGLKKAEKGFFDAAIEDYTRALKMDPQSYLAYYNRANALEKKGALQKAIEDAYRSIAIEPGHANSYGVLGVIFVKKREFKKSIINYSKAIKIKPKYSNFYHNRAIAWEKMGKLEKAIADYSKAIFLRPNSPFAYNSRGGLFRLQSQWEEAIIDFTRAIALNPKYADAYANRGVVWAKKNQLEKAIDDFTKAISLNPRLIKAYNDRANAWQRQGELKKAIADYTQVIALNPAYFESYYNRGNIWLKKKELRKAIVDYTKVIALNPKFAKVYNNLTLVWLQKGELEKAVFNAVQAIALNPKYAEAYSNLGIAYGQQGKLSKALHSCSQAIALNPKYAKAYYNRGNIWTKKRNLLKAVADYTQAIVCAPKFIEAYFNRANTWSALGKIDKAITDFTKVISLRPKDEQAYYNRGNAWLNKGKLQKAIEDYTQVVAVNPRHANAYYNRAAVYDKMEQKKQAALDFASYLRLTPKSPYAKYILPYIRKYK